MQSAVFLFVKDELSYDRFHDGSDRIYRVVKDFVNSDGTSLPMLTPPAVAPAIQHEIPGIEHVTRVFPNWGTNYLVTYKERHLYTKNLSPTAVFSTCSISICEGFIKRCLQGGEFNFDH